VTVHGVLVEAHQQVDLVAVAGRLDVADAHRQQDVTTADDRLVGVVGVDVQPTAHEHARQDIARRSDALAGGAANGERKIEGGNRRWRPSWTDLPEIWKKLWIEARVAQCVEVCDRARP